MPSDNQNNFHWKNKLEDVESLSSEAFPDKNNTWEKLHARLDEKPRRKAFAWYWIAAACLLLAVIIPAITMNKKQNAIVKTNVKPIEQNKKNTAVISTPEENKVEKNIPVITEKKDEIKSVASKKEIKPVAGNPAKNNEDVVINSDSNITAQQPIVSTIPVVDSTRATALSTIPAKKKIKVVHINELGDVVEISPDVAHNTDLHSFQLKLATQEIYRNPSAVTGKAGFTILKKKYIPSN